MQNLAYYGNNFGASKNNFTTLVQVVSRGRDKKVWVKSLSGLHPQKLRLKCSACTVVCDSVSVYILCKYLREFFKKNTANYRECYSCRLSCNRCHV